MKLLLWVIFIWMAVSSPMTILFAQKQAPKQTNYQQFLLQRKTNADFTKIALPPNYRSSDLEHYLKQKLPNCQSVSTQLNLIRQQKSPIGTHYTFQQLLLGLPIYQAQVQVTVNRNKEIISITENTYHVDHVNLTTITSKNNSFKNNKQQIKQQFLHQQHLQSTNSSSLVIVFDTPTSAQIALTVEAYSQDGETFAVYVINEESEILFQKDQSRYYHQKSCCQKQKQQKELVIAYVFEPDPITSAQAAYGLDGKYRDNEDEDRPELTAERKEVRIEVRVADGFYILENPYIKIVSLPPFLDGSPVIPVVTPNTPIFDFTRSQSGFEDVNTYYHLNQFRNYINRLQFKGGNFLELVDHLVEVDTHGANGEDNSQYRFQNGMHYLIFGEGNVDDAEDADVIVHEYCHSISQQACFSCNFGFEREAIDEAIGDYFATSYSRSITSFNWQNMFSWDGHNPFFAGRNMNNNKTYPADLNEGSIHLSGEIWGGTLMDIWEYLGRETTDKLVLQTMYSLVAGLDMPTVAALMLLIDRELCDKENQETLSLIFAKRGLIAANDFFATQAENIYTLQVSDHAIFNGTANDLVITLPVGTQETNLTMYDIGGRLVTDQVYLTDVPIHFNNKRLKAGIYIVRAIIDGRVISFKFSKAE